MIGASACPVISATSTQIKCSFSPNSAGAGAYPVVVQIDNIGFSNAKSVTFTSSLNITSLSYTQG